MNTNPFSPGSDEHEVARLVPTPTVRALPSDRSRSLKELVMTEIQQSARPTERPPVRPAVRRRLLGGVSALGAAAAAATVASVTVLGGGTPAYALTSHSDGSISVQVNQLHHPSGS